MSALPAWSWPGARWWRCDLHIHTPASEDFKNDPPVDPAGVVDRALQAGLDAIAVTDHDSGQWVDRIREAAADSGVAIIPGAEITTVERIHLLLLGDITRTTADVNDLLSVIGIPNADRGKHAARSEKTLEEVMQCATDRDWLCVAAHADAPAPRPGTTSRGLWAALADGDRRRLNRILDRPDLVAAEMRGNDASIEKALRGVGLPGRYRREPGLAVVRFSDAHALDKVGQRSTWIKMTRPDREGLALAFSDGDRSIQVYVDDLEPNRPPTRVVKSVSIKDLKYAGRDTPLEIDFNPWLNVIIGGRGAGKSTIVNALRLALGRAEEAATDSDFERFNKVGTRDGDGALMDTTLIAADYWRDGHDLRASWSEDGSAPPLSEPKGSGWVRVDGAVSQRTPVRVVGQGELARLAEDPRRLLGLVDDAPPVDRATWQQTWDAEHARFLSLRARAREARTRIADRAELSGTRTDLDRAIAVLESDDHRDTLRAYQRLRRQDAALDAWWASVEGTVDEAFRSLDEAIVDDPPVGIFDGDGVDQEIVALLRRQHAALSEGLRQARDAIAGLTEAVTPQLPDAWDAQQAEVEAAYQRLTESLAGTGADPSEYSKLISRRQAVDARLAGITAAEAEADRLDIDAAAALQRLAELGTKLFDRRKAFLNGISTDGDVVRFQLERGGERDAVLPELRDLLLGSADAETHAADVERCAAMVTAAADGLAGAQALKATIRALADGSEDSFGGWFTRRVAQLKPEALDRLDAWFPADRLQADYLNPDGEWQPIIRGSAGQRNAAILAFLLSYGDEPLVIDQPENDLDNALIMSLVVRQLRKVRRRRQLVIVTHNPNIVVNADADLVVSLEFSSGRINIAEKGGLQEQAVREEICRIVEGGRQAFEARYERIGERHV